LLNPPRRTVCVAAPAGPETPAEAAAAQT